MTSYLYVGPSLPDASDLVEPGVQILPPIGGGDILQLRPAPGDVVGIVDGFFHQRAAVRHKEILAVLAQGIRVLGAASIGALRAAELHPFGMEGVGGIYRDYRDGIIEGDDEVALVHGAADIGYQQFSQPLVNIRATLDAARVAGLVDDGTVDLLVRALTVMGYHSRTWRRLREVAVEHGLGDAAATALHDFCREHTVDRKRADALELVGQLHRPSPEPDRPCFDLSNTIYLRDWQLRARGTDTGDGCGWISERDVLRAHQLFGTDFPHFYQKYVLDLIVADCVRQCGGPPRTTAEPADLAIAHGVHRGIYPALVDPEDFLFLRSWLSPPEWGRLSLKEQVVRYLVRSHLTEPGLRDEAALAAAIRSPSSVAAARTLVYASRVVNQSLSKERPTFDLGSISAERISEWFATHWNSAAEELDYRAMDRGIDSREELLVKARSYYLAARFNPELARLQTWPTRA